jgi:2'-5' RNA ligase
VIAMLDTQTKTVTRPPRACALIRADVPEPTRAMLLAFARTLPPDDLRGEGVEPNPHLTVLYGVQCDDPAQAAEVVARHTPASVTLLRMIVLRTGAWHVLAVEARSYDLWDVRRELEAAVRWRDSLGFRPHVTIARLRRGAAARWADDPRFHGLQFTVPALTFSSRHRLKCSLPFSVE